ncbi:MAG: type I restriction-modification system subunit M N-terminal domain-containing protein, partial [Enterococcus italicus]
MVSNQNSKNLYQALWSSADILRSKMDANEYKNYLLGIVFYKYLSDRMLVFAVDLLEESASDLEEAQVIFTKAMDDGEVKDDLIYALKD